MNYEFRSHVLTTFDDELGKVITNLSSDGWEMFGNPQFIKMMEAAGWNPYAIGHQPHFLVLFRRQCAVVDKEKTA